MLAPQFVVTEVSADEAFVALSMHLCDSMLACYVKRLSPLLCSYCLTAIDCACYDWWPFVVSVLFSGHPLVT